MNSDTPSRPHPKRPAAIDVFLASIFALIVAWPLAGAIVLVRLLWGAPLTDEDLRAASWLGSRTTALHFGTAMAVAIMGFTFVMGLMIALAKQTLLPNGDLGLPRIHGISGKAYAITIA